MMMNTAKKKMLITGVSGLLGNNLAFCLKDTYDILGVYHTHKVKIDGIRTCEADLSSRGDVDSLIKDFEPEIIVHCAAQADVDICEEMTREAEQKNVLCTKNLVQNLNGRKIKLVFISTDLVYDGVKGNFSESDPINPLNCYGATKCRAEKEILEKENALILRTNFFGWNIQDKHSLGEWAIHELTEGRKIKGFADCIFSGIYTFEFATILDLVIKKDLSGIYNCASSTSISKYDFISEIANRLSLDRNLIRPISIDDFGFKAKRAKNLGLNVNKLARDLSVEIPPITFSIEHFISDFRRGLSKIIKANGSVRKVYPVLLGIIPYGRQAIDDEDIAAVVEVLKFGPVAQGPKIQGFESALCQMTGATFAVAVNSGTSALHMACLAAEIGPGDEVITSPNTFVASANCAVYCGGKPVFADIDARTYNISPENIEAKINERTKAVIPVHFAGQSCHMEAIQKIITASEKKYGHKIYIIEDACHALGSRYKEMDVGSCAYSDMAVLSFHPVKHITTGEGGAVLTNDQKLRRKLSYFRSHGITSDPEEFIYKENAFEKSLDGHPFKRRWYYEQNCLGFNYRTTDIQCALGISQLKKIDRFHQRRREIVNRYNQAFQNIEWLTMPFEEDFCDSNFHLYVLQFDFEKIGMPRGCVMAALERKKIQTQAHYIPVHTQPFYQAKFGTKWGDCPQCERYYQRCLSIPLFPAMTDRDVEHVIEGIHSLREMAAGSI